MVADCITPDPDKRPDVTQVLAVATAMHSKYDKDDNCEPATENSKSTQLIEPLLRTQLPSSAVSSLSYSPGNPSSLHSSHSTMADSFKNIRLSP